MAGTFGSFSTGLSGLRQSQAQMDIAATNTVNANTVGYTRRRLETGSVSDIATPAVWSRSDGFQGQVEITGISRLNDILLDIRARREHGQQAFLDTRVAVLNRVESGIGEPGDKGLSAQLTSLRTAWSDLANHPDSDAARSQVLAQAASVAQAFADQFRNVDAEAGDQRLHLTQLVSEVNTAAKDLAELNRQISRAQASGSDISTLADHRDVLAMQLAELAGGVATVRPDGGMDVTVGGTALVTGTQAGTLAIATGVTPGGASDGQPITFSVTTNGVTTPTTISTGSAGAVTDLLQVTLPAHQADLDQLAEQFAQAVNALTTSGYDADGNPGLALFSFTPGQAASSLSVTVTDPRHVTASSLPGGVLDGSLATSLSALKGPEQDYQRIVNQFGTSVASAQRQAASQRVMTTQVDSSRDQLSGVNQDEEMVSMLQAQRSFEAASRLISVLDGVLDTLINRTGLVR